MKVWFVYIRVWEIRPFFTKIFLRYLLHLMFIECVIKFYYVSSAPSVYEVQIIQRSIIVSIWNTRKGALWFKFRISVRINHKNSFINHNRKSILLPIATMVTHDKHSHRLISRSGLHLMVSTIVLTAFAAFQEICGRSLFDG